MIFKWIKALAVIATLMTSYSTSAQDDVDPLANFKVSKTDILKSLETLKNSGQIGQADYDKAVKELGSMSNAQVEGMAQTAIGMVRNDPDKATSLLKSKNIDLKEVEKQIGELSRPKE